MPIARRFNQWLNGKMKRIVFLFLKYVCRPIHDVIFFAIFGTLLRQANRIDKREGYKRQAIQKPLSDIDRASQATLFPRHVSFPKSLERKHNC
jgi:hypothetical protein